MFDREKIQIELIELDNGEARYDGSAAARSLRRSRSVSGYPRQLLPCVSFVSTHSILGVGFGIAVSDRKHDRLRNTSQSRVKSPGVCRPPGLFLNVHKIRADSDNKR